MGLGQAELPYLGESEENHEGSGSQALTREPFPPLVLVLRGYYYDSQIYKGRLYAWGTDGTLDVFDWDLLVDRLKRRFPESSWLALVCAFARSDYLYGQQWLDLFADDEVRSLIIRKFLGLAHRTIEIPEDLLRECLLARQDNPFAFPHSDSVVYRDALYVADDRGLSRVPCKTLSTRRKKKIRPTDLWEGPAYGLSAAYDSVAVSAGQGGLLEVYVGDYEPWWDSLEGHRKAKQISSWESFSSRWAFYSIYSSSYTGLGFLADFDNITERGGRGNGTRRRCFRGTLSSQQIFDGSGYSWGAQEKLCQIRGNTIVVVGYEPWARERGLVKLGEFTLEAVDSGVVFADSALFGLVIEHENGLVVVDSVGREYRIDGEPTNWRVFPRSVHYRNQLHIIRDDCIEVYSFNHDYFVPQASKLIGLRFFDNYQRQR